MPKPSKAWKAAERRVAAIFGSRRTPLSGGNSAHTRSDSLHDKLFIETKQRKTHTVWSLFDSVRHLAKRERKLPVIALDRTRSPGCLIVIHSDDLDDFCKLVLSSRKEPEEVKFKRKLKRVSYQDK